MKKIIFSLSALAALLLAGSCQRENLEPVEQGGTVTYTVQVPQDIATKATGDDFTLHYEVYRKDANGVLTTLFYKGTEDFNQGTADVQLEFVKDQKFKVLFWAQQKNGAQAYDITDLRSVSLNTLVANDTTAEVFAGSDDVDNCESANGGDVVLVRPVAQLNIATTAAGLQLGTATVKPTQSKVVVDGLYDTYNVATGTAVTKAPRTYTEANVPGLDFKNTYKLMATNYLGFIPQAGDNVEVTFTIYTENDGNIEHTVSNVPVKANYQTNILGNLISATSDYQVTLEDWADAGKDMEVLAEGLVKNINGDYEVSTAKGLAYAINNLFVDADGVANAKTFYVKPGLYDMAQQAINDITVTSGTLKVYDTEAVVTRSVAIEGVIITGLSKALIQTVEEDATVFFSGITVTDFNGADDAAALVQNNEGKVVLADCQILDENGAPDLDTELVDGINEPVKVGKGEETAGDLIYTAEQLAAAFEDESVESIALGADITLESTLVFPEGRTATLDLRGWKLMTAENMPLGNPLVAVNGDLTITDSYGIGGISASKTSAIQANHGGKLTINCNVTAHEATVRAIGGEAIISGGKYVQTGTYYSDPSTLRYTIDSRPDEEGNVGKIKIDGGEFISNNGVINAGGEITINGGTFNNDISEVAATRHMMYVNGSAVVNINGGEFFGKAHSNAGGEHICVYTSNANVNIAAGKFTSLKGDGSANYIISEYSAGSTISVTGGMFNTNLGLTKYIHKDYKAVKNADTEMWDVVAKVYVAKIGEDGYESLKEAVEAVKDGETITFDADVEQVDGIIITDKNITVNLNGKTFTVSEGASTNNRNFKINGSSVVTIKNGTMIAAGEYSSGAYGTVRTEGTANVTLEDVKLYNYRGNGLNVKALSGTTVTISDTEVYSQYGGGIESAGGTIELTNVKVEQKGMYTAPYNSMAISVNGGGTVTVNSGTYSTECITAEEAYNQGTSHGPWCAGVLNSGGTLIINGGTFSNDNFGENSLATYARGLLLADTGAKIEINGGTFNALAKVIDIQNNLGDASKNPTVLLAGGNYSSNPLTWAGLISAVEGKDVVKGEDDRWTLVKVQQNNEIWYTSDEMKLVPTTPAALNANIVSNVWDSTTGKGVITFDAPLTAIGNDAFKRETNTTPSNWMTSITLPNGVTSIGDWAFYMNYSLVNVTIPKTVISIGDYAFGSCWELKTIICKSTTPPTISSSSFNYFEPQDITVIVPAVAVDIYKADSNWKNFNIVAE